MLRFGVLVSLVLSSSAFAAEPPGTQDVEPGELYGHLGGWTGNAYTIPSGHGVFHPFLRSGYGLTEFMDVKFQVLGLLFGPQAGVELAPLHTDKVALSFEPYLGANWRFDSINYSAFGHFSAAAGAKGLVNLSLGVGGAVGSATSTTGNVTTEVDVTGVQFLRIEAGYEHQLAEHWRLVTTARTNTLLLAYGTPNGAIGVYGVYGNEAMGASLGVNLIILDAVLDFSGIPGSGNLPELKTGVPLPLPHMSLWARF